MTVVDDVRISNSSVAPVRSARTVSAAGNDRGEAVVELQDSATNRSFDPDDTLEVQWSNGTTWTGDIIGRPSESNGVLTYRAHGRALPLQHENVFRVFYDVDSSAAVSALINEQAEELSETEVHTGDDASSWTSIAPVAEVYGGARAALYERGTDMLFLGCRAGHSDELRTTFDSVPSTAIADGIYELKTRIIAPAVVAEWEFIVELKTPGGTSYRWEPDLEGGAQTLTLRAEEAEPADSGLSTGDLRYRFTPTGTVATNSGFFIDWASTIPFRTTTRSTSVDAAGVESTDRTIRRRVDGRAGSIIQDFAVEDEASWWVENGSVQYQPGTSAIGSLGIDESTTPIVAVDADRDFESIRNEVLVVGGGGIEEIARSQSSIQAYGRRRPTTETDPQLIRQSAAEARAEGEIADQAFDDADITFDIADISYAALSGGQQINVTYSPENLDGTHKVSGVAARSNGVVSVTISASTVR